MIIYPPTQNNLDLLPGNELTIKGKQQKNYIKFRCECSRLYNMGCWERPPILVPHIVQFVCTSTLRRLTGFWHRNFAFNSAAILGGNMKINVEYNKLEQTENLWGPFIFIRDGDKIRNFEAVW